MNDKNLVSLKDRTQEERREIALKGAKASQQVKQEKKILKEEILKRLKYEDMDAMINNLIERAKTNSKDFEILRDTVGQKPKIEQVLDLENEIAIKVNLIDD